MNPCLSPCASCSGRAPAGPQVLLGMKKTGFGLGKIVGLGGHVKPGESDAEAACREVFEEAGVVVREEDLRDAGNVEFVFPARPEWNMSTACSPRAAGPATPSKARRSSRNGSGVRHYRWSACGRTQSTGCRGADRVRAMPSSR